MKFNEIIEEIKIKNGDIGYLLIENETIVEAEEDDYPEEDMKEFKEYLRKEKLKAAKERRKRKAKSERRKAYVMWSIDNFEDEVGDKLNKKLIDKDSVHNFLELQREIPKRVKNKFDKLLKGGKGQIDIFFGDERTNIGIRQVLTEFKDPQGNPVINGILIKDGKELKSAPLENIIKTFDSIFIDFKRFFSADID